MSIEIANLSQIAKKRGGGGGGGEETCLAVCLRSRVVCSTWRLKSFSRIEMYEVINVEYATGYGADGRDLPSGILLSH